MNGHTFTAKLASRRSSIEMAFPRCYWYVALLLILWLPGIVNGIARSLSNCFQWSLRRQLLLLLFLFSLWSLFRWRWWWCLIIFIFLFFLLLFWIFFLPKNLLHNSLLLEVIEHNRSITTSYHGHSFKLAHRHSIDSIIKYLFRHFLHESFWLFCKLLLAKSIE